MWDSDTDADTHAMVTATVLPVLKFSILELKIKIEQI